MPVIFEPPETTPGLRDGHFLIISELLLENPQPRESQRDEDQAYDRGADNGVQQGRPYQREERKPHERKRRQNEVDHPPVCSEEHIERQHMAARPINLRSSLVGLQIDSIHALSLGAFESSPFPISEQVSLTRFKVGRWTCASRALILRRALATGEFPDVLGRETAGRVGVDSHEGNSP